MCFNKSKWIWCKTNFNKDNYAEFIDSFKVSNYQKVIMRIASDSVYNVFLNNKLVAFSQCADFPHYKLYDEIDITKYCNNENNLRVDVWHYGEDSQTYINSIAGVIFEIIVNDEVIVYSNENTLSKELTEYKNNYCKKITGQLGFSFYYDNRVININYSSSVVVDKSDELYKREIKQLVLLEPRKYTIIKKEDSYIIDIGRETAGFVYLDIDSNVEQLLTFTYGEHINDGDVRRIIGSRDFSFEFFTKKGNNKYLNSFRRIAGRYIQVYFKDEITINNLSICEVTYPIDVIPFETNDKDYKRIYDVCLNTLKQCMHEHYEDCPWREQALYVMDSRNQMLCGYYTFKGFEYQKHNLILIAKSLRKDGLLSICAPSGIDIPIPSFSLYYIIQVYEYIQYTKDSNILNIVGDAVKAIYHTFKSRLDTNNLIAALPYPFWNFYEWEKDSHNDYQIVRTKDDPYTLSYDLILNCIFVYVTKYYNLLFNEKEDCSSVIKAINDTFYDKISGVYHLSTITNSSSQLGNSFAILSGAASKDLADKIINDESLIKVTLSMKTFMYDALLMCDKNYKDYILKDIKTTYLKMLDSDATSVWETILGEKDFDNAGSLCHGWSAIPIYYLNILK